MQERVSGGGVQVRISKWINWFLGVRAELEKSEEQTAISPRKGQTVVLQCRGGGKVITSPILYECRLRYACR